MAGIIGNERFYQPETSEGKRHQTTLELQVGGKSDLFLRRWVFNLNHEWTAYGRQN